MKKIIIFIVLFFSPCTAYTEHYQWIENGIHHFSNCRQPPEQRGNFTFQGSRAEAGLPGEQTTPEANIEKKEAELSGIIKKIEDRNNKVKAIKETYFQPGTDILKNLKQLILPEAPKK
jgi:hypothetical protein